MAKREEELQENLWNDMEIEDDELANELMREIVRLRTEQGISQVDMAEMMGYSQANWNRKENQRKNNGLKLVTVYRAARVLGVHPAKLLGRHFEEYNDLYEFFEMLNPEHRRMILEQAKALAVLEAQRAKLENKANGKD